MKNKRTHQFSDFHAGKFLQAVLAECGHDASWLAARTGRDEAEIERLLALPNMDAMLFVRLGHPMGQVFYDRIHEEIFGSLDKPRCQVKATAAVP